MKTIFCILLITALLSLSEAGNQETSFEDARCKCICPNYHGTNSSDRTVYISDNGDSEMCRCKHVVKHITAEQCNECECQYQSRNTTTIKVVVIFTICVVSMLFVYMVFLFLLDHLVSWRPSSYHQHVSEERSDTQYIIQNQEEDEHSVTSSAPVMSRAELTRQRSIINYVTDEQKRWKGTVQEQRRNIYDRHSMLN